MATSKGGRRAQQQAGTEMHPMMSRENLDRKYKPFFDQYAEDGGIPLRILRQTLVSASTDDELPPDKLELLLQKADTDRDGVLDYEEFVRLMTADEARGLTTQQLSKFQFFIKTAVSTVVPKGQKLADGETDMIEDYTSHYNCKPPPLFMIIISLTELIIFIAYAVVQNQHGIATTMISGAPLESPLVYNPARRYEAWRFLTYMFIHDGIKHILSNLIFQLLLGLPLEMVHKFWRVGIVYCLGVIAGSLCTSIVDPRTMLVGASGGCYALIGAHFAIVIMNWQDMTHDWMSGPIKFILSAPVRLAFWSIYAGVDTAVAIYSRYANPEVSRVAFSAHIAGLFAGILIGIPVLKNFHVLPWEKVVWWVALVVYLLVVLFAVCWNGFYTSYYPITDWNPIHPCCPCPLGYYGNCYRP